MPSALPGISTAKAAELLQITDRLIRTVPEVATVFGKAGRLRRPPTRRRWKCSRPPSSQATQRVACRDGPRIDSIEELDRVVRVPGSVRTSGFRRYRNRIDMLATGIKVRWA
jgi:Cu(I)/Ag(I) efflux system membrane protein CusA/SilA